MIPALVASVPMPEHSLISVRRLTSRTYLWIYFMAFSNVAGVNREGAFVVFSGILPSRYSTSSPSETTGNVGSGSFSVSSRDCLAGAGASMRLPPHLRFLRIAIDGLPADFRYCPAFAHELLPHVPHADNGREISMDGEKLRQICLSNHGVEILLRVGESGKVRHYSGGDVHIMFSERLIDDVEKEKELSPKLFFKYPARKRNGQESTFEEREKHGAPKDRKWSERSFLAELRADFARIQNDVLEKHGFSVRVDHCSLKAQRREALQNGDTYLAQLLDRVPEKYIGLIAHLEERNPQVEDVKKYRMARKEHQDILYAADMLEREIEELALKDNTQEAALAAKELIESGEYQRQPKDSTLIGELRDNVLSAIREVNALKNIILTKKDAEEQVMLEYLTASERELWHRFKESKAQKAHWETFMGNMKKPPATEPEALRTYEEIANGVAKQVAPDPETPQCCQTLALTEKSPDKVSLGYAQSQSTGSNTGKRHRHSQICRLHHRRRHAGKSGSRATGGTVKRRWTVK